MTMADDDRRRIARSLSQLRRNVIRDFAFRIVRAFGDDDISLPQLATMLLLDEVGAQTIKGVAELLGRSLSATSRLLDHLVMRGLVDRREDEHDRRVKRVAITARGRQFIGAIEQQRAGIQIAAMDLLTPEERADAIRGMELVVEASRRKQRQQDAAAPTAPAAATAIPTSHGA